MEKYEKMCIKSEFKEIFFKLATNGRSEELSVDIKILPLPRGYMYKKCLSSMGCLHLSGAIYIKKKQKKNIKKPVKNQTSNRFFFNWQQMGKVV